MKKHIIKSLKKASKGGRILVMATVLIGIAGVSYASAKTFSIGPRATYSMPKYADQGNLSVGAQARMDITPALKLEGSIDYRSDDLTENVKVHVYPVQASVLAYIIPPNKDNIINPFMIGGLGWYYTQIEAPNYSYTTNRGGVHIGAGVEFLLSDKLSLDVSYRNIWLGKYSSEDISVINEDYEDSGYMITTGLNFLF